jgi:hypothetical protein
MSVKTHEELTDLALAALRQAARDAAKISRDTGTPLIVKDPCGQEGGAVAGLPPASSTVAVPNETGGVR